ncbi:uncharacterized protein LOC141912873 [Tubulanus polymorphus]|uniref:uncharacterized protein LOC141912873 n=1 Tax=Tubulanus polymorphus TaxID=672921 RepID=UPI003DA5D12A
MRTGRWSPLYLAIVLAGLFACVVFVSMYDRSRLSTAVHVKQPQILKHTEPSEPSSAFYPKPVVDNCVTWTPVYKVRPLLRTIPFKLDRPATVPKKENTNERMASFQEVYSKKLWGTHEPNYKGFQGSGSGSSVAYAQNMMKSLNGTINAVKKATGKSKIRFLDIPCGDMVWMPKFLTTRTDVIYTGMDIVPEMIDAHNTRFANMKDWSFRHQDIVNNPLNEQFDIIHSRHMLQHLTTGDALKVLDHLSSSGSLFLLTTTWSNIAVNRELPTFQHGRFRRMNLEIPPFNLEPPACIGRDWPTGNLDRELYTGLWPLPLRRLHAAEFLSNNSIRFVKSTQNVDFETNAASYE